VAYIFFNCLLAQFMWSGLRTTLRVFWNPLSFANFCDPPAFSWLSLQGSLDFICYPNLGTLDD
jgi:hypothetical protein